MSVPHDCILEFLERVPSYVSKGEWEGSGLASDHHNAMAAYRELVDELERLRKHESVRNDDAQRVATKSLGR